MASRVPQGQCGGQRVVTALPCVELVERLNLSHDVRDGYFLDCDGKLAAFDPSIAEAGPSALLLRLDLLDVLRSQGIELLWLLSAHQQTNRPDDGADRSVDISGAFWRGPIGWAGELHADRRHQRTSSRGSHLWQKTYP